MAETSQPQSDRYALQERLRNRAAQLAISLSGGRTRLIVLGLAILFSLWQLYVFAWVPLSAESALPEGIASVKPELDMSTLTKIRDARVSRLQHKPNLFSGADQFFAVSSLLSPTPAPKP